MSIRLGFRYICIYIYIYIYWMILRRQHFFIFVAGVVVKSRTSFFTFLFAELIIFHFKMLTYAVTVNIKSNAVPCYKSLFL